MSEQETMENIAADTGGSEVKESPIASPDNAPKELDASTNNVPPKTEDETIAELLEMGFSEDKVSAAIEEAKRPGSGLPMSADALITWISKQDKIKELEERMKIKRIEREEREKKEAIEREKNRRTSGKELLKTREEMEAKERIRIAEEIRREKREKEMHKQRILDQIKQDRENQKKAAEPATSPAPAVPIPVAPSQTSSPSTTSATKTRIAVRLPNGEQITQEFGAQEPLASVRVFCQMKGNMEKFWGPSGEEKKINFVMPPAQVFTEDDMNTPLKALNLVPSARLLVKLV